MDMFCLRGPVLCGLKYKVHYSSWSESKCWRTGFGQVRWCLRQAGDFSGWKTCRGQESAITTCGESASRFAVFPTC